MPESQSKGIFQRESESRSSRTPDQTGGILFHTIPDGIIHRFGFCVLLSMDLVNEP